eukprot:364268-Chlamydomonas_euryale.AAC.9
MCKGPSPPSLPHGPQGPPPPSLLQRLRARTGATHLHDHEPDGVRQAARVLRAHQVHHERALLEALGDLLDPHGHSGAEEQRLALVGHVAQDLLHVLLKAHVEHLIGLVQDGVAHGAQPQVAALDEVDHAARRAHHDVDTARQVLDLPADRGTAIHRHNLELGADPLELARDLVGQLTRGREHHSTR